MVPVEVTVPIPVDHNDPSKVLNVGSHLEAKMQEALISFLKANLDVFAWSHADMCGISPDIAVHALNIDPKFTPVKQKRRTQGPERSAALKEEVDRLMENNFIKESTYPNWVSNPVLVKKANGKWRVCIDFSDLNKACPKDSFPLPRIDQLVDGTAGHELLSFMDAYSGYNQIMMHEPDQEDTSFITDVGLYCYRVMPFGLKNAGATYQRLVNAMFKPQIGKTMEVYVDDMLVKSKKAGDHMGHLSEMFAILRKYGMKLNPLKCSFGVESGKFLGFIVSARGIEANPAQISALREVKPPRTKRELQSLNGKIAALSRFISKATDRCIPFFDALKKGKKNFEWTPECQTAFDNLIEHMEKPPMLSKPADDETLFLYLAVSSHALSAALIREDDKVQYPVYYISKRFTGAEKNYPKIEKLAYCLLIASRKLRPYFQAYPIRVLTDQPLKQVLFRPETSGRLLKWNVELSQHDITYYPRRAINGQALADFIAEFTDRDDSEEEMIPEASVQWKLYVDGARNNYCSGAGIVLETPEGRSLYYALRLEFPSTNNEAEYEALIAGLRIAKELNIKMLLIFSDSQLVVCQVKKEYQAKEGNLPAYLSKTWKLLEDFDHYTISHIPREENMKADSLAKYSSNGEAQELGMVPVEVLTTPSIDEMEVDWVMGLSQEPETWMTPIKEYLLNGKLPEDRKERQRLLRKAPRYMVQDGRLYRYGFSMPLLRCVSKEESRTILAEVHGGECGDHTGGQTLAKKILRYGYFWPEVNRDAADHAKKCDRCQRFAKIPRAPSTELTQMVSPWPFAIWGIDLIGPLPIGRSGVKYAIVAVDYFTKWAEAEPMATITSQKMINFVTKNIICRYGVPQKIITDNGTQFESEEFQNFCKKFKIQKSFSAVAHPQANGQVEAVNKIIKSTIKKQLEQAKGGWVDKLPFALWAYRTTHKTATGHTPFSLAYGAEAMIPVELEVPTHRRINFNEAENEKLQLEALDQLDERRIEAELRAVTNQKRIARHFNSKVRHRSFEVGDLVLKRIMTATGVFGPNWEGPYIIGQKLLDGTFKLTTVEGDPVPRAWNIIHLRPYFT